MDGDALAVLWLYGPPGVGKSTVGWELFTRFTAAGLTAGYVDIDQLGMCFGGQMYGRIRASGVHAALIDLEQVGFHRPASPDDPANHRLKAANVAALWRTYHAAGAQRLVLIGEVDSTATVDICAAALPATTLTVCRLHAGRTTIRERIMRRGRGLRPIDLAGDQLIGRSEATLAAVADRAVAEALDRVEVGDLRVDTDGRDVDDLVDEILRAAARRFIRWSRG